MINFKRILPWILVALWMSLIFLQSHKPALESNNLSKSITEKIVDAVEKVNPNTSVDCQVKLTTWGCGQLENLSKKIKKKRLCGILSYP